VPLPVNESGLQIDEWIGAPGARIARMNLDELSPRICTGDVFLFHGVGVVSRMIEFLQATPYSHSGVAVRHGAGDEPMILHASAYGVVPDDAAGGAIHNGVQLVSLRDTLAAYEKVDETCLYRSLEVERTEEMSEMVRTFIEEMDGRQFAKVLGPPRWIEGRYLHRPTGDGSIFCSQMVATLYQRLGLLGDDPPANAYAPKDFSEANTGLALLRGARLAPEVDVSVR
jgi:hypothetical protein